MKIKNSIPILGIVSIIILTGVQIIILSGIYRGKSEMFNLRYRLYSQDALTALDRRFSTDGFDTARLMINNYSEKAGWEIAAITDSAELTAKKKDIIFFVKKVLNEEQYLSGFLSDYFEKKHVDKNFKHKIIINYFEIIHNDEHIPIYLSEEYSQRILIRKDSLQKKATPRLFSQPPNTRVLVKSDWSETNFYRLEFDYFIDFWDKHKIVMGETAIFLILSTLSILVVVILFLVTYKNLMEERRLSNLKTDFINNMTHELKTPLSTITVAGKTLLLPQIRGNDEKIVETARLISKQGVHLNQLINMILEISMWERTQFQIDKKTVQIESYLKDIVESFKSGNGNDATITEEYNFKKPEIGLDVIYFTTLLNNLLSNAVKYCDKEPVINIEGTSDDNNVYIKISDNGVGISKIDQKHIFDKFYRASTGNIHKYKGLGLGLYYVFKIAEAHGGQVTVSSKPGKGSIFTVIIPY